MCSALQFLAKSFNDDITVSLLFGSELLLLQSAQRRERDEEIRDEGINCWKKHARFSNACSQFSSVCRQGVPAFCGQSKAPCAFNAGLFQSEVKNLDTSPLTAALDSGYQGYLSIFVKRLSIFHSHADNVSKDTKETGKNATETHNGKKKTNLSLADILSGQHPNKLRFQVLEKFFFQQRSLHIWSERRPPFV